MAQFVEIYCRIAIRLCVGYFDDGRERYRTVNIWNVRRDVTADQVAAVVRALEPILDGRVVRVLVIRKDRLVVGDAYKTADLSVVGAAIRRPQSFTMTGLTATGDFTLAGDGSSPLHPGLAALSPLTLPLSVVASPNGAWQSRPCSSPLPSSRAPRSPPICLFFYDVI